MKRKLIKWLRIMLLSGVVIIAYTLLDFSFNLPEPVTYQFKVPSLILNSPVILKQNNMMIIVARYSQDFISGLQAGGRLARLSSSFRQQPELIDKDGYFIVLGYGTQLGCPLIIEPKLLKESCSDARYSLLGKSQNSALYADLKKVDYKFSQNHTVLTIN